MSDQDPATAPKTEQTGFTHTSSPPSGSNQETGIDDATEATTADVAEHAAASETESVDADTQASGNSNLPDPAMLLAMAAMHMPTLQLMNALIAVFDSHAWRNMGLVADHSGDIKKDMPSAQLAIDCLAFLLGKVEQTLEDADRRDIQRRLTDLRMNYLAKMREA